MVSTPPKFVCTRTPTVYPPSLGVRRREDVPMPPLKPNATVPVPAPTEPSSTDPPLAFLMAANASSRVMCRPRMSFRYPSFVSPTSGLMDSTSSFPRQHQHVVDERVSHTRHAQSRCEQNWGLDLAKFIHLGRTSQLAEGVAHENRARHLFPEQIAGMRKDGGHASAHIRATDDGGVPDLNASDIGDRIKRPGRQYADLQPQGGGTWSCIGSCVLRESDGQY